ncbi:MAG: alpha-galactosidase [Lentisphaeria bacterium]
MSTTLHLGQLVFEIIDKQLFLRNLGEYDCQPTIPAANGMILAACGNLRLEAENLQCIDAKESRDGLSFVLEDSTRTVQIRSEWKRCPHSGLISRRDRLQNCSVKPLLLRRFLARFPFRSGDYEVYAQINRWGRENQGQWNDFNTGTLRLSSRWGRSTEGGTPFAAVREKYAAQAIAFHVLPEGNWCCRFNKQVFSNLKANLIAELGQADEDLCLELLPGEQFHGPEILLQVLPTREIESGSAALHRYALEHLVPPLKKLPVVYNTWLDKMAKLELPRLRQQLQAAKKIGCEAFVIDAGWYIRLGDWRENETAAFFGKMADFSAEVRKAGLRFGIWFEAEALAAAAPALKQFPHCFQSTNPQANGLLGGNFRIRCEIPDGCQYLYDFIAAAIQKYELGYIKFDMNNTLGYDPSGSELRGFATGWYQTMQRIHQDFPDVIMENCASGALRTDLNTLRIFDTHFVSDNADPWEVLRITQGMLLRFPPGRIFRWLVACGTGDYRPDAKDSQEIMVTPRAATWYDFSTFDLQFGLFSNFMGVAGFSGDLAGMRPETLDKIAAEVSHYKEHRQAIFNSEVYLLTPVEPLTHAEGWITFQFLDRHSGEINLFAFHKNSDGDPQKVLRLQGLDPEACYLLPDQSKVPGAELMQKGLRIKFNYEQHGYHRAQWLTLTTVP